MKVVLYRPGEPGRLPEIENSLEALQGAVGGYIETVTLTEDLTFVCNEEGRLMGLPFNRKILGINFVGPVLAVGVAGEEFCDVPEEAVDWLMKL